MSLILHGFRYSVYVRIARIALAEKGLTYEKVEIDPFATDVPIEYLTLHPFKRVPVLVDGDFALYETEAITRGEESFSRSSTRTMPLSLAHARTAAAVSGSPNLLLLQGAPGAAAAAADHFRQALDWAHRQEALSWELRTASSLARLWRDQHRVTEARALLGPVYARFTEGFATADLREAKSLLQELE